MTEKEKEKRNKLKLKKSFGAHLQKLRKAKNLSPTEFGRKCDMDSANVAKIERGDANLTLYTLYKVAEALDITILQLLKDFDFK